MMGKTRLACTLIGLRLDSARRDIRSAQCNSLICLQQIGIANKGCQFERSREPLRLDFALRDKVVSHSTAERVKEAEMQES